ncbi:HUWE1-associated protein modifying stress responses [Lycorma delicatula]|uniref:HUWE1-associated protein modifying stress responses n=1 Tax=Lycorma delicatula TaxID=130591 RepID=UPI003F5109EE
MNDEREQEDALSDIWITNWEQQCVQHLESEPDYEGQLHSERDLATQKAWCCFQNAAASIAQLYKDRLQDVSSLWLPFQTAAGTVATLYKESTESIRRSGELGVQCGYQRRTKELLSWARKKRRNIRREDLISYLAGKALPPRTTSVHHRSTPRPLLLVTDRHSPNHHQAGGDLHHLNLNLNHLHHHHHHHAASTNANSNVDDNLHMFREALALSGGGSRRQKSAELSAFVAGEFARHCTAVKRQSSSPPHSHDVNMDSPTHPKRPRFM